MPDDTKPNEWAPRWLNRSAEVMRYAPASAPVPAMIRLWRALTHLRRPARRALPRCRNCGYLVTLSAASPTGWTHGPHWQGVPCPGGATGAELR